MEKLQFSTTINAPKEIVWKNLWEDEGYRKWTSVFTEGSYAESSWEKGSVIRFLSPNGNGMYALINEIIPFQQMVFEHQGEIINGEFKPQDWGGSKESYFLEERNGVTQLTTTLDATPEMAEYFNGIFPKAMAILKEMCEREAVNTTNLN
jgi:uncharacterized protein YndB with AHSA1/START domain